MNSNTHLIPELVEFVVSLNVETLFKASESITLLLYKQL